MQALLYNKINDGAVVLKKKNKKRNEKKIETHKL